MSFGQKKKTSSPASLPKRKAFLFFQKPLQYFSTPHRLFGVYGCANAPYSIRDILHKPSNTETPAPASQSPSCRRFRNNALLPNATPLHSDRDFFRPVSLSISGADVCDCSNASSACQISFCRKTAKN